MAHARPVTMLGVIPVGRRMAACWARVSAQLQTCSQGDITNLILTWLTAQPQSGAKR